MIRFFDIVISFVALLVIFPILIVIGIFIKLDSPGKILFASLRIGQDFKPFNLYKLRTMYSDSGKSSLITFNDKDSRITGIGHFLRKYKLDELPQLFNVLKGDMSIVGSRPEIEEYVRLYNEEQRLVLNFRPGITDYASIKFRNESELLSKAEDPNEYYLKVIMPEKLQLNLKYLKNRTLKQYFRIIILTFIRLF